MIADPVAPPKQRLSLRQILSMNLGFLGIQYSFGLQQSSMSPIYKYLGADEGSLPYLWLAGPMTGLLIQPLVGAISDRTVSRYGRRVPYFMIGAIICSLCLLAMPFSPALWIAASLLWMLDAGNNITMEPYRAFVSDKLPASQHSQGFLTQSAFTGLGQTLAYLTPSLLVIAGMNKDAVSATNIPHITYAAFIIGAFISIGSILWTVISTPEIPLTDSEISEMRARPVGAIATLREIAAAIREMPPTMRQMAPMMLFQWYALFCFWQYIVVSLSQSLYGTTEASSQAFRDAGLVFGRIGAFYNFIAFISAFVLVRFTHRHGPKAVHATCLVAAGVGLLALPLITDPWLLLLPMVGMGLAWASIMGNPYVMLAGCVPAHRTGVYMGIFNMFIVIPMLIQIATLPQYYHRLLASDPRNVVHLAGALLIAAAIATLRIRTEPVAGR